MSVRNNKITKHPDCYKKYNPNRLTKAQRKLLEAGIPPFRVLNIRNQNKCKHVAKRIALWGELSEDVQAKIYVVLLKLRRELGIRHLMDLNKDKVQQFANNIARRAHNGEISQKYAKDLIYALNKVLSYMCKDEWKVSAKELGIYGVPSDIVRKPVTLDEHHRFIKWLKKLIRAEDIDTYRYDCLKALYYSVLLQGNLGLTLRESLLFSLLRSTPKKGVFPVYEIRKKKPKREVLVWNDEQLKVITEAVAYLRSKKVRNLLSFWDSLKQASDFAARVITKYKKETGATYSLRGERVAYGFALYRHLKKKIKDKELLVRKFAYYFGVRKEQAEKYVKMFESER